MGERDEDFDDIIEEWEDIPMTMIEIKVEVERDDEILVPIPIRGNGHKVVDIDFDSLPEVWKPFVRCHHHERECLERLARKNQWHYDRLVKYCIKIIKREIRDIGELSKQEANNIIDSLGGKIDIL